MTTSSQDIAEFETALKAYKKKHGRMFPTCSEILEVARGVGYQRHGIEYTEESDGYEEEMDEDADFDDFESAELD